MTTKTIDEKGRLTLGREFAGRQVQIEDRDGEIALIFCRTVPDREAWLWENEVALAMVRRGIEQAAEGGIGDGPDLNAALAFADSIPDDEE